MPQINPTKRHLLSKRAKMIKFLKKEGYDGDEIATIFSIDKSAISRILSTESKYKGIVRLKLSDKRA